MPLDFAALFEASPNAYMVLDRELRYVAANQTYLTATRRRRDELVGTHIFAAFPHDPHDPANPSATMLRESFERVLATGAADSIAMIPYRAGSDEIRYWSATHTPLLGDDGRVAWIVQHTVDVTALLQRDAGAPDAPRDQAGVLGRAQRVQEAYVSSDAERRFLRRLFEQAPGFVCFLRGPQHVFELSNRAYDQLVGHRDIVGKPIREALPEIEGQGFVELLDRVFATGEAYVGRSVPVAVQRKPDAPLEQLFLDFVYQPILEPDGRVSGIFVQGTDITELKSAEQERRFLAEAIPQQVWTAGSDGALDFVNQRVAEYLGGSVEQALGAGWHAMVHPEDLAACLQRWTASLASGDPYEVQFRLRHHDGSYRWHLGRALAFRDAHGQVLRWFGTNTDIDEARQARDQLHQRAEFEQQLIGIVSHDLRNPLNAIAMSAALLLRRGQLDAQQGKTVGRIVSATERAGRLIRDFLDFSQARSVGRIPIAPGPADLRELARTVVEEVHQAHPDREVRLVHDGASDGVWDGDRLAQAIGNLVANAFQHSAPGSEIRVHSRVDDVRAVIAVHNDGPPIAEADQARLFEPFQRGDDARPSGSRSVGLGLYIASQIIAAHGGHIGVTSRAPHGTTFTIELPRHTS